MLFFPVFFFLSILYVICIINVYINFAVVPTVKIIPTLGYKDDSNHRVKIGNFINCDTIWKINGKIVIDVSFIYLFDIIY